MVSLSRWQTLAATRIATTGASGRPARIVCGFRGTFTRRYQEAGALSRQSARRFQVALSRQRHQFEFLMGVIRLRGACGVWASELHAHTLAQLPWAHLACRPTLWAAADERRP